MRMVADGHIATMMSDLEAEGRTPWVRLTIRKTLNRALNRAVRLGLLPQNPCANTETVRVPRKALTVLSPEETKRFLDAARADRLFAMYVLAITGGLRQGELFALQWPDLDLDAGFVTVQRSLDRKIGLAEPKTRSAHRRVELPAMAVEALKAHLARQTAEGLVERPTAAQGHVSKDAGLIAGRHGTSGEPVSPPARATGQALLEGETDGGRVGTSLVFCDTQGGPLRNPNVVRRSFRPILDHAGLPRIRFHDLRHLHASLLLLQGENPKVVQERLGHSKIELTLGTYSHLMPGIQRAAADRLGALLST